MVLSCCALPLLLAQTNPHIVPALNLKKRVNRKLGNLLEAEWKHRWGLRSSSCTAPLHVCFHTLVPACVPDFCYCGGGHGDGAGRSTSSIRGVLSPAWFYGSCSALGRSLMVIEPCATIVAWLVHIWGTSCTWGGHRLPASLLTGRTQPWVC